MPTPLSTFNVAITSCVPSSERPSRIFATSTNLAHNQPAKNSPSHPVSFAHQQRRQAKGCTTLVETQTWLPPNYDTCSMQLMEVACNDLVLTGACPPNKIAPAGATSISTAAHTSSSSFPPHVAFPSNDSSSSGKSALNLGLGVCFGVLATVLIVALFIACVTKLQRPPRSREFQRLPLSTIFQPVSVYARPKPLPGLSIARHFSGSSSSSSPSSSASNRASNKSSARGRHSSDPSLMHSDLRPIAWPSEGRNDRASDRRKSIRGGGRHAVNQRIRQAGLPNNVQRSGNDRERQRIGENEVVDPPAVADAAAVAEMEQIQIPEAQRILLRQARLWRKDNAGPPTAPPIAEGRVSRNRVHF